MKTVYHPNLPLVSNEVEDSAVDAWVAQGWLKTEPKVSKDARAEAEAQ